MADGGNYRSALLASAPLADQKRNFASIADKVSPAEIISQSNPIHCRETRYFTAWQRHRMEEYPLLEEISALTADRQATVPFGDAVPRL